jgi:hypothetical protein
MATGPDRVRPYQGVIVTDAVAQAEFSEKKWVWVQDKQEGYVAGWITQENGENITVELTDTSVRKVNKLPHCNAQKPLLIGLWGV